MTRADARAEKKAISFSTDKNEVEEISKFIEEGWEIVKLVPYGKRYIGIMEKNPNKEHIVYIPPKKMIVIK